MNRLEFILKKVPAGLMVIPLLLGALIHTVFPRLLEIGSFTTAIASGSAAIMGVQMICLGSRLKFRSIPGILAKSGVLLLGKLILGFLAAGIFRLMGQNLICGFSILTVVSAISNTNGSLYLSLTATYGETRAAAGTPIISLNNGPFFPMLILGAAGIMPLAPLQIVAMMLPMVLGMILGNCWKSAEVFLANGVGLLIPFIGFSLGASMDLRNLFYAGAEGILLAVVITLAGGLFMTVLDRTSCGGTGVAGMASSATGANAVMVPAALTTLMPDFAPIAAQSAAQLAVCAIVGALLVPVMTGLVARKSKL